MIIVKTLQQAPIFNSIDTQHLEAISLFCNHKHLEDGDVVIEEHNDEHFDIFVILSGKLEIVSQCTEAISDEAVIHIQDHGTFGEIGWLNKAKRTATVRSIGPLELLQVDGDLLDEYLARNTDAGYQVMRQIALKITKDMKESSSLLKQLLWIGYF